MKMDDGTDIMCCGYKSGEQNDMMVDAINSSGAQSHYKKFILKPGTDVIKSPITKAEYPMSWDIEIPELDAKLYVESLAKNQEMICMSINCWPWDRR